jgi:hypothetical protein
MVLSKRIFDMKSALAFGWNFIFDYNKSPLRHIPEGNIRHMVYQVLGWMWAISFSIASGTYAFLGVNLIAHAVLIGAAAITVTTYTAATMRSTKIKTALGRRPDGEHI